MQVVPIMEENMKWFLPFILPRIRDQLWKETMMPLGIMEEKTAFGALVMSFENEVVTIESLYISPEYRRRGAATALLEKAEQVFEQLKIPKTYQRVVYRKEEIYEGLQEFLNKKGFSEPETVGWEYGITLEQLKKGFSFGQPVLSKEQIKPICMIPEFMIREYQYELRTKEKGVWDSRLNFEIERDMSMVYLAKKKIQECLLFQKQEDGIVLEIPYLIVKPSVIFFSMLKKALDVAEKKYAPETTMFFQAITSEEEQLFQFILKNAAEKKALFYVSEKIEE